MAKKSSLDDLINDFKKLEHMDNILSEKYDNIIATIMCEIGKRTAYDTGASREIIQSILKELGRPDLANQLNHVIYEFWHKLNERLDVYYELNKSEDGRYDIMIYDYGFANQSENGIVSRKHPRKDRMIKKHHVDYVLDRMETGSNKEINKAFSELEKFIVDILEGKI